MDVSKATDMPRASVESVESARIKPRLRGLILYGLLGWVAFAGIAFGLGWAVDGVRGLLGY
jgi:hypothetical protein